MQLLSDLHKTARRSSGSPTIRAMLQFATETIFLLDGRTVTDAEYKKATEMLASHKKRDKS
jgi:hypothetical protein